MITDWFRSKRAVIADRDALEVIVAKQTDEIAGLRRQAEASRTANDEWVSQLRTGLGIANDQVRRLTKERDDLSATNIRVRNALQALRDDITREEQAALFGIGIHPNLPSAAGPGMARVANQPMPWQDADAITQDAAAKRAEDL